MNLTLSVMRCCWLLLLGLVAVIEKGDQCQSQEGNRLVVWAVGFVDPDEADGSQDRDRDTAHPHLLHAKQHSPNGRIESSADACTHAC